MVGKFGKFDVGQSSSRGGGIVLDVWSHIARLYL